MTPGGAAGTPLSKYYRPIRCRAERYRRARQGRRHARPRKRSRAPSGCASISLPLRREFHVGLRAQGKRVQEAGPGWRPLAPTRFPRPRISSTGHATARPPHSSSAPHPACALCARAFRACGRHPSSSHRLTPYPALACRTDTPTGGHRGSRCSSPSPCDRCPVEGKERV